MRYVALLRGVNVGGVNKVSMAELKSVFVAAGMTEVLTYINSGNVIFSAGNRDRAALGRVLKTAIDKHTGFPVDLLLRDTRGMESVVKAIPASWKNDGSMKCDVFFLWDDVDEPAVLDRLPFRRDLADVVYVPGAVVCRVDRANVTRSSLTKIVGTPLYRRMTIRNCNTVRKLLELMRE